MKKAILRSEMRQKRQNVASHARLSQEAMARFLQTLLYRNAETILMYLDLASELETTVLFQALLADSRKRCVVPYCLPNKELGLFHLQSETELARGKYGIREPSEFWRKVASRRVEPNRLDLVLVPGLAWDFWGGRLGQGGGYYDRFLPKLSPRTRTVGAGFDCQILDAVPLEPEDYAVDFLVTESRWIRCRPLVVGVVGGIACGKSLVSEFLAQKGAAIFPADQVGHQALEDPEIREKIVARWGVSVLDTDTSVSRPRLAQVVFSEGDGENLAFLNRLVHPWIEERWKRFRQQCVHQRRPWIVLDAALLLETGWQELCDEILFVETPRERQLAFAQSRDWTEEELLQREKRQFSLERKRAAATAMVKNDTTLEALRQQLEHWLAERFPEKGFL